MFGCLFVCPDRSSQRRVPGGLRVRRGASESDRVEDTRSSASAARTGKPRSRFAHRCLDLHLVQTHLAPIRVDGHDYLHCSQSGSRLWTVVFGGAENGEGGPSVTEQIQAMPSDMTVSSWPWRASAGP